MTELWSAGGTIPEMMLRQAYVALGAVVLGFVVLEALYLVWLALFLTRWKAAGGAALIVSPEQAEYEYGEAHEGDGVGGVPDAAKQAGVSRRRYRK